jgi:hypothetical protein
MPVTDKLALLERLHRQAESIREELGISSPGAILFSAELYAAGDDLVVVEADGFGRATTSVVVGNYPIDYLTKSEKVFGSESEALAAAQAIVEGRGSPALVLASQ